MNPLIIIKQYLNIIIGVAIAGVTFYLSSLYYNHKIDNINKDFDNYKIINEKNILNQKLQIAEQNQKILKDNQDLQDKLKEVENEKYKLFTDLQKVNNTIKSNVSNGVDRLYINAKCPSTTNNADTKTENNTTSTMDDGKTTKAVIDPRDATTIIEITNKGDKYKEQLEALQDWINKLIEENNKDLF